MPRSESLRCYCVAHACNVFVDDNGQPGRPVNAYRYRLHQKTERSRILAAAYSEIQREVLEEHDAQLAAQLSKNSPPPPSPTMLSETAKHYRIQKDIVVVNLISPVVDKVSVYEARLKELVVTPTSSLSVDDIGKRIIQLERLDQEVKPLSETLEVIRRSHRTRSHPTKELYNSTVSKLDLLLSTLENTTLSLRNSLAHRQAQEDRAKKSEAGFYDSDRHFSMQLSNLPGLAQVITLLMMVCSVILRLSERGYVWLISMVMYIIQITAEIQASSESISSALVHILSEFPRAPAAKGSLTELLGLGRNSLILATCPHPKCRKTHKPVMIDGVPSYRERCDGTPGKDCRTLLVRRKQIGNHFVAVPILPFISYDVKDWVASLLARPQLEEQMDNAWESLKKDSSTLPDVFHGSVPREFRGPDGKHFGDGNGEGRYLFSLSVDWFNPLTNKQAGKKLSVGVISLVCLNIPIDQRYKPENMFLAGIIPGPHEPILDTSNHFLTCLIDDLLDFWKPGVFFSKTSKCPEGRRVRCALIALVCDLPAARKIAAYSSHNSNNFCSVCGCTLKDPGLNDFNVENWKLRTDQECREHSTEYRNAPTSAAAQKIFNASGRRWSELERLPYFDITRFVVVDPMHNLLLGLLQEHFRFTLGFEPKHRQQRQVARRFVPPPVANIDDIEPTHENPLPSGRTEDVKGEISKLVQMLRQPLNADLEHWGTTRAQDVLNRFTKRKKSVLVFVARGLGLHVDESWGKKELAYHILSWRRKRPERDPETHVSYDRVFTSKEPGHILYAAEIDKILTDIECMVYPSWMTKPSVLSGGKLKADEWRTLCTATLPMSLIRLWSSSNDQYYKDLLEMTMSLVSAVIIACSRVTSPENAQQYRQHLKRYRELLHQQFPGRKAKPNEHMAMHIDQFLLMYGPVHSWWTFPFERLIGMLQRVPTNYIPGEYEASIAARFVHTANLKALFQSTRCPQPIRQCLSMFERLVAPDLRQTHVVDALMYSFDDSKKTAMQRKIKLGSDLTEAFKAYKADVPSIEVPIRAIFLTHLTVNGIRYSTYADHRGNSAVLIPTDPQHHDDSQLIPARIEHIMRTESGQVFIAVCQYQSLHITDDPFRKYPALRAQLWSSQLHDTLDIIDQTMLRSHYASWTIPYQVGENTLDATVIMSLSRNYMTSPTSGIPLPIETDNSADLDPFPIDNSADLDPSMQVD